MCMYDFTCHISASTCKWLLISIPCSTNGHSPGINMLLSRKFLRTPLLSFAEPMLCKNASCEDSFITCQTTPKNHGSLVRMVKIQLSSGSPFSGQIIADKVCLQGLLRHLIQRALTSARSFGELSRKYPYIHRPQPSAGGRNKVRKQTPRALALGPRKASLLETWMLHLELVS